MAGGSPNSRLCSDSQRGHAAMLIQPVRAASGPGPVGQAGVRFHGRELAPPRPAPQGQDGAPCGVDPDLARRGDHHQYPGRPVSTTTSGTRWRHGPVHVFNPLCVGDVPCTFGRDVVAGCPDPAEAFARADALVGPRRGNGDMAFWQDKAAIALAALLHAADLTPAADILDIWAWCNRYRGRHGREHTRPPPGRLLRPPGGIHRSGHI